MNSRLTFLPTVDPLVYYCPQTSLMYVSILNKKNEIIYRKLTEVLENFDNYFADGVTLKEK